jgi:hypothetical protein
MAVTEIAVPSGVWVKALSSRIRMICATRSGSPLHVYRARIAVLGVPPDPLEQHPAREDASGIGRGRGEDSNSTCEANTTVSDHHTPAVEIDLERPGDDRLAGRRAGPEHVRAAQRSLHPAAKLAQGVGEQLLDRMLVVHEKDASRSLGHGTRVFGPS